MGGTVISFVSHSVKEVREIVADDGLRGTRARSMERVAQGLIHVAGDIVCQPTPTELTALLPYALQGSTAFTLTDAMQDFTLVIDEVTKGFTSSGRFNTMRISGSPGKKLDFTFGFIGYSMTTGSGGTISTASDLTQRPYVMSDMGSGITIGGTTYLIDKFELTVDNGISPTFMQGQTATDLAPADRQIHLSLASKFSSTEAPLLITNQTGPVIASPITGSLAFTNGSNSITFSFPALVATSETPTTPGGAGKLRLPLNYQAYKVGSSLEMVITNT